MPDEHKSIQDQHMVLNRDLFLEKLGRTYRWDLLIIGGGATGLGAALDAASRGFKTLLLEQSDFAKATSSRSTKLVHGGVRYLAQGNLRLVYEALHERERLLQNAPGLVDQQPFVIPCYNWLDKIWYGLGLKLYDLLAGKTGFRRSRFLSKREVIDRMAELNTGGLIGGVEYFDGKFDDSRLAIKLAQTAARHGAVLLNYVQVKGLSKTAEGLVGGVRAFDLEKGKEYHIKAAVVINATGVFVDQILKMDQPLGKTVVRPSQGVHLVFDRSFLAGDHALMIPKTSDGRVLFGVPWHGYVLVGTTDTPLDSGSLEPVAMDGEIDFILFNISRYLTRAPRRADILSVFAGLRPLAAPDNDTNTTKEISRSHKIMVSRSGLVTVTGGKWTTYRKIAEDVIDRAIETGPLVAAPCLTKEILICSPGSDIMSDFSDIHKMVRYAVQEEMARTVEDVLARRIRMLFMDARRAMDMAPVVAACMAAELGRDQQWEREQLEQFMALAGNYLPNSLLTERQSTGSETPG